MMKQPSFNSLIRFLTAEPKCVSIHSKRFVAMPEDCDRGELEAVLKESGYSDEIRQHNSDLVFSLSAEHWQVIPPIYQNEAKFWKDNGGGNKIPDEFFIVSSGASNFDEVENSFIKSVRVIFSAKTLLNKIADHYIVSETKALLFVNDESRGLKKTISYSLDVSDVLSFSPESKSADILVELIRLIEIDDPHESERKHVLRKAVALILDEPHYSKKDFLWFLGNIPRLKEKYSEQYEVYFHNFSASKLLNEIDQKSLEFNSKLMDFISNSQNKALTIPGAIVAVAALIRIGWGWQTFLVMIGVLLVAVLVTLFNHSLKATYADLRWQISKSFAKYKKIQNSDEVSSMAEECESRLKKRIDDAEKMLKTINFLAWATFVVGVLYSLVVFYDLSPVGAIERASQNHYTAEEQQKKETNFLRATTVQQQEDQISQKDITDQQQEDHSNQAVFPEQQQVGE